MIGAVPISPRGRRHLPLFHHIRDAATLQGHFKKHGKQFGAKTPDEYARLAQEFRCRAECGGFKKVVSSDGVTRYYDPSNNTFAAYNADGTTRTMFKPSAGEKYWTNNLPKWSK